MTADADTLPAPSDDEPPRPLPLDAVLLAGLTANGDETPALSVLSDVCLEIGALTDLLGLDLHGEALDRSATIVLLDGITRRLTAGVELMRRELTGSKKEAP